MPWLKLEIGVPVCHPIQGVPSAEAVKGWKAGTVYKCDICGELWLLCVQNRGKLWFWKLIVQSNTHATREEDT